MVRLLPAAFIGAAFLAFAAQPPKVAGHWEGVIKGGNRDVPITVDIAQDQKGAWVGTLSMPAQGARDIPLSGVAVQGNSVRFNMFEAPGSPVFQGEVSPDGRTMSGKLLGGGESTPFELKRTGEPNVKLPPPSGQIAEEFVGTWEGDLGAAGKQLHLVLQLARAADGAASGVISTAGQGAGSPQIPLTTITQNGDRLDFEIRAIGATFSGTLGKDHKDITGKWTQGGDIIPMQFKRK